MSAPAFAIALAAGLFTLGAAVIACAGARRFAARAAAGELWRTYLTTFAIVAALLVPAALHPIVFCVAIAAGAYRCAIELTQAFGTVPASGMRFAVAAFAAGAVTAGAQQSGAVTAMLALTDAAAIVAAAVGFYYAIRSRRLPLLAIGSAYLALAAATLAHLIQRADGFACVLLVYATVEAQDSMAFVFGRVLGRRKTFGRLSPRKTLEGAIAGALFGVATGTAVGSLLLDLTMSHSIAAAVVITGAGFAGDLFFSAIKRVAGIKDFARVDASHGGLLDIYDSTVFGAVALGAIAWRLPI